jgi:hypothetical protein
MLLILAPTCPLNSCLIYLQNSCGGDWAADTSRGGDAGKTSSCQGFGIIELKAMEVENWDDGCKIIAYDSWSCENELMTWDKEKYGSADGVWSCINNIDLPTWEAFKYVCE